MPAAKNAAASSHKNIFISSPLLLYNMVLFANKSTVKYFTCYDEKGCCYCAIEKAYREGRCDFYKPISCHLYPIRVGDYGAYKALNYHKWDVCKAAVLLGEKKNMPVYKFLKEPLVRRFGESWYRELERVAEELEKQHVII